MPHLPPLVNLTAALALSLAGVAISPFSPSWIEDTEASIQMVAERLFEADTALEQQRLNPVGVDHALTR